MGARKGCRLDTGIIFVEARVRVSRLVVCGFFFSSRRRHTRYIGDWSSDGVLFRSGEVKFPRYFGNHVSDVRILGIECKREAEVRRQAVCVQPVPVVPAVVGAVNAAVVLLPEAVRSEERRVGKGCGGGGWGREG